MEPVTAANIATARATHAYLAARAEYCMNHRPKSFTSTCGAKVEEIQEAATKVKAKIDAYDATVVAGVVGPVAAEASAAVPAPAAVAVGANGAPVPQPPALAASQGAVPPAAATPAPAPAPAAPQPPPSGAAQSPPLPGKRKRTAKPRHADHAE